MDKLVQYPVGRLSELIFYAQILGCKPQPIFFSISPLCKLTLAIYRRRFLVGATALAGAVPADKVVVVLGRAGFFFRGRPI